MNANSSEFIKAAPDHHAATRTGSAQGETRCPVFDSDGLEPQTEPKKPSANAAADIIKFPHSETVIEAMPSSVTAITAKPPTIRAARRFVNRELSWLDFNERVLEEASNPDHPLLERLRFLSISDNNLNEFFAIRVAGLKGQVRAGVTARSADGLPPKQQLRAVNERTVDFMDRQQIRWAELRESLQKAGINIVSPESLSAKDLKWLERYFMGEVFSVLTPVAIDPAHPFPFLPSLGFTMALMMEKKNEDEPLVGLITIPQGLPRFVRLSGRKIRYLEMEQIISLFLGKLFPGFKILYWGVFQIIRDCDIEVEEEAEDLVRQYEEALRERRRGSVIRLAMDAYLPDEMQEFLQHRLKVRDEDVFAILGLVSLVDVAEIITEDRPDLMFKPFRARFPERIRDHRGDCFAAIRQKDLLVHHPYESFDVVVQFLRQAAEDPDVVAIKQTLYRTSEDSPIIEALISAAESGKTVTALVELKARFDEERNIRWARDLEHAGVQVVYGFVNLKTHAKVSFVVRKENRRLRSYVHFGTGNYHPITAKIYTDLSFFTCNPSLCRDAATLFNYMTGSATPENLEKLFVSPLNMREELYRLIDVEIANARAQKPAGILVKMNSLVDPDIIDRLYRASRAGVPVELIIRGICCLRPGVPGLSENIVVRSIVGRFLEHSRIICFAAGHGITSRRAEIFISSADWMPRNLDGRVETLVPIENSTVRRQIVDRILWSSLNDDTNCWLMGADGSYARRETGKKPFSSQHYLMTNPSLSGRGSALKKKHKNTNRKK